MSPLISISEVKVLERQRFQVVLFLVIIIVHAVTDLHNIDNWVLKLKSCFYSSENQLQRYVVCFWYSHTLRQIFNSFHTYMNNHHGHSPR